MDITLENEKLCLRFDPEMQACQAFIYKDRNENVIKKVLPGACFRLVGWDEKAQGKYELTPGNLAKSAVVRAGKIQTLQLHYESVLQEKTEIAMAVDIQIVLEDDQSETSWYIKVEKQAGNCRSSRSCSHSEGIYLGETWEMTSCLSHHAGEKTALHSHLTSARFTSFTVLCDKGKKFLGT